MRPFPAVPGRPGYVRVPRDALPLQSGVRWERRICSAPRDCTYTISGHIRHVKRVFAMMPPPSNLTTATPGTRDAPDEVGSSHAAGTSVAESTADAPIPWTPSRRSTASWVVYDLGDTVFQQTMITNYFPVWVVAGHGRRRWSYLTRQHRHHAAHVRCRPLDRSRF